MLQKTWRKVCVVPRATPARFFVRWRARQIASTRYRPFCLLLAVADQKSHGPGELSNARRAISRAFGHRGTSRVLRLLFGCQREPVNGQSLLRTWTYGFPTRLTSSFVSQQNSSARSPVMRRKSKISRQGCSADERRTCNSAALQQNACSSGSGASPSYAPTSASA